MPWAEPEQDYFNSVASPLKEGHFEDKFKIYSTEKK